MRKEINTLIIVMILILTGCSNREVIKHNYTYRGESEYWVAEYNVDGEGIFIDKNGSMSYESHKKNILTVTYKNDLSELSSIRNLKVSYKSSVSGGSIAHSFDNGNPPMEKTYEIKSSGSGVAIESKDETIKVSIDIDGNIETIELNSVG
ncbi:hypothetical protein Curi_c00300 [Gottschalkia acidurici 9a]|uniref:Lipoprotein n=1 Tax=Gottschalkia acidurici (strain ATCC 7906 / DSM 604 / BCRC 14475 / CIP 104303 / KCTC 5404 / NCIMB 10678 / 9a) TaxID=1128398 RepID=K0AWH7_GOTA9|nr:hypothetical protein [Gottschalkia acidurici]AFS77112.1 hypothetical protein Curi_c00300 [Gottschalkia acidurici 9a]